jgi:ABC-2 type transport system permease protein
LISALLYLQYHSLRNRLWARVRRLRQPKYLVGGIVGALYFYFYFFRYLFGLGGQGHPASAPPISGDPLAYEFIGGAIFFVAVVVAWVVPHERAALAFSEAEVAFLFPAPISRRGLIQFKLFRSQTAILFTTLILMLVANRFGGKFWIHAAGWWLILSTVNLHFLGSSFARTLLLDRGITNWQRRLGILVIVVLGVGVVSLWAWRTFPRLDTSQFDPSQPMEQTFARLQQYFHQVITSGPLPYLLYPFRLVVRPYLAANGMEFLRVLPAALLVLALHYVWVIRSDVAFEEASVDASRKLAETVAAMRAGNWQAANRKLKGRRAPFVLRPMGAPIVAFLWKNLISAGRVFNLRMGITLGVLAAVSCAVLSQVAAESGLLFGLGMAAGMLFIWSLFLGPQVFRHDLRQDLPAADVLKMYPLRGWQLVLGELLAPAAVLTVIQWSLLILAVGLLSQAGKSLPAGLNSLSLGLGAAMLVPVLNLIMLQIPNSAVLLFPAWFLPGKESAQGIEATGQRIIFMLGQVLVFLLTLIPAVIAFGVIFFLVNLAGRFNPAVGLFLAVPLASLAAAVVLGAEAAFGLILLGNLFDRFDLSSELNK